MRCSYCGSENRNDAKFCGKCGKRIEIGMAPDGSREYVDASVGRDKRTTLFIVLMIATMAMMLAIVFLLLRSRIGNNVESQNTLLDGTHISDDLYYSIPDNKHIVEDARTKVAFVDNEVIVYLTEGCTQKDAKSLAEQYDGEVVGLSAYTNSYQLRLHKACTYDELNQLIEKLEADSRIEAVSKNIATEIRCDERTSDPVWSGASKQYWGLTEINAPEAWDIVQAGPDVHIGIMDSQFYTEHEDLSGAFAELMPSYETSFNAEDNGRDGKHGTHVAGIIGARANGVGTVGVAPNATLYGYSAISNLVDKSGETKITLSYGLEIGWTYLIAQNGCRVINMSLSSEELTLKNSINSESVIPEERQRLIEESSSYANSIRALVRAGYDDFVICKSAGNTGDRGGLADYDILGYISDKDVRSRIIIVGSVSGSDGQPALAGKSCRGRRVDIVAPGEEIYSTYYDYTTSLFGKVSIEGTYSYLSGTSMATPMVAGVAALVIAANPSLKGDQVKQIICESAERGGFAVENEYTVGLLDAEAAVKKAVSDAGKIANRKGELATADEAYAAYATKLEEYIGKYGSPQVVTGGSTSFVSGDGVCLAELVDFDGDGLDELYLAYYDPSKESTEYDWSSRGHDANAYVVEVWSFVDGEVAVAYQGGGTFSNQQGLGSCARGIRKQSDKGSNAPAVCWVHSSGYHNGTTYESTLWSVADGASKLEHKWEVVGEFTPDMKTYADGEETELNESDWLDTFGLEMRTYHLQDFAKNDGVSECVDLAKETMARLGVETPKANEDEYTIHFSGADLVLPEAMRGKLDPTVTVARGGEEQVEYAGYDRFLAWSTDTAWADRLRASGEPSDYRDVSSETLPDGTRLIFGEGNDLVCQVEIIDPAGNRGILTTLGFSDFHVQNFGMTEEEVAACRGLQDAVTGGSPDDDPMENAFAFLRECAKGLSFTGGDSASGGGASDSVSVAGTYQKIFESDGGGTPPQCTLEASVEGDVVELSISYCGKDGSPIYTTESRGTLVNDSVSFDWVDSWGNSGTGTIVFSDGAAELTMVQTQAAGRNRWSFDEFSDGVTLSKV